jgi:hypothetical protein
MKILNRWQCWIIGIWESLREGLPIDGCDYKEIESENKTIMTLECQRCGKISSGKII